MKHEDVGNYKRILRRIQWAVHNKSITADEIFDEIFSYYVYCNNNLIEYNEVFVSRLVACIRAILCPHTIEEDEVFAINHDHQCQQVDYEFGALLFQAVLSGSLTGSWTRICKTILRSDLNETVPYDGSIGLIRSLRCDAKAIFMAASNNDVKMVQLLESRHANQSGFSFLESKDDIFLWPLAHFAASAGACDVLLYLSQSGVCFSKQIDTTKNSNPLHQACSVMDYRAIKLLIDVSGGSCIGKSDIYGQQPLHYLLRSVQLGEWRKKMKSSELLECITHMLRGSYALLFLKTNNICGCLFRVSTVCVDFQIACGVIDVCFDAGCFRSRNDAVTSAVQETIVALIKRGSVRQVEFMINRTKQIILNRGNESVAFIQFCLFLSVWSQELILSGFLCSTFIKFCCDSEPAGDSVALSISQPMFPILHLCLLRRDVSMMVLLLEASPLIRSWAAMPFDCPPDYRRCYQAELDGIESLTSFTPLGLACLLGDEESLHLLMARCAASIELPHHLCLCDINVYRESFAVPPSNRIIPTVGLLTCCVLANSPRCMQVVVAAAPNDCLLSVCCQPGMTESVLLYFV